MRSTPVTLVQLTFEKWYDDNVLRHAAALAYYTMFAVAPLLIIVVGIAGAFYGREAAGRRGPGRLAQHQNAVLLGQLGRPGAFFRLPVCGGGCGICRCGHTHTQVDTLAAERA